MTAEINLCYWLTSLTPSWKCPSACLVSADWVWHQDSDAGLQLQARFMTPAKVDPSDPWSGSHITRGCALPAPARHSDQTSNPSWGCGWRINTVHTSTYRPTDSGHTIVTLGTHRCHEPAWLDYLSLTMVCPVSEAAPSMLIVRLNLPHLLLSIHLGKALCSQKISSFLHPDQNQISNGWIVLQKSKFKIQDFVLPIPGDIAN